MGSEASKSPGQEVSHATVQSQVERISSSQIFARSRRLREFLRFVVDETLAGRGATLKEQVIAHEIYGRQPGSASDGDPVVRVDARRLRDKLREFYSEAKSEPVIISLPKGGYTPLLEENAAAAQNESECAPSLVREQLGRILASSGFRSSEAPQRLLRYTVEVALSGKSDHLKEYAIAVEALGRPSSFDPHQDTIVRVQARKLRERLAAWYAGEGRNETCRIVFRPGSYAPLFTTGPVSAATSAKTIASFRLRISLQTTRRATSVTAWPRNLSTCSPGRKVYG